MNILFLGYAVNEKEANGLTGVSVAGNKMQVNVLKALNNDDKVNLRSITIYPVAAFPNEKRIYITHKTINITESISSIRIGFCNLPILKQLWQTVSVYRQAKKMVDSDTVLFAFNMFPQVGLPAKWMKRKYGCKVCSLLADLPIDDNIGSKNIIRNAFRKLFERITCNAIKSADFLVALNANAVDRFAPGTPYIIVEGGVNLDEIQPLSDKTSQKRNLVYGGALTEYSGILTLIEAMNYIEDKDIVLDIYGGGYIEEQVKALADVMPNVFYCGRVSNEKMLEIQRNAYLLVNPRPTNDPIAKVTFPSKLFEYMTSGTPVISTHLNGLTDAFVTNLYIVDNETPEGFAETINEVTKKSREELSAKAQLAYSFIVNQKTWNLQAKKMVSFFERETGRRPAMKSQGGSG